MKKEHLKNNTIIAFRALRSALAGQQPENEEYQMATALETQKLVLELIEKHYQEIEDAG